MGKTKKSEWVQFTRRTEYPKLQWLIDQLAEHNIECVVDGESWHAPISWVKEEDEEAAWEVLDPVDDIPDDDPRFNV